MGSEKPLQSRDLDGIEFESIPFHYVITLTVPQKTWFIKAFLPLQSIPTEPMPTELPGVLWLLHGITPQTGLHWPFLL